MHISELKIALSADDLRSLLLLLTAGAVADVEQVNIVGPEVRIRVRAAALPMPVELAATVAQVSASGLVLNLDITNMRFLPGTLRTAALEFFGNTLDTPGVSLRDGQLAIGTDALARALKARFALAAATLSDGKLNLHLRDVHVPDPPRPTGPAGPATALTVPEVFPPPASLPVQPEPGMTEHSGAEPAPDPSRELPPERPLAGEHQGLYDSLRARIQGFLDQNLPAWLHPHVKWLLLLPDFLVLLARLAADNRITGRAKLVAAGALAYITLPLDLVADFVPGLGLLDDVAVALLALEALVTMSPVEVVREHWPGNQDVLQTIRSGLQWAGDYFPRGIVHRLRQWLERSQTTSPSQPKENGPDSAGPPPLPPVH